MKNAVITIGVVLAVLTSGSALAQSGPFLVNERNASTIWTWEPGSGNTAVYHSVQANDADLAADSTWGWIAEHFTDHFGRFVPGSGSGLDQQYSTPYAYPKHITFFSVQVIVMSRNDATIYRYDESGAPIGNIATGNVTGQGLATDGPNLYASFWNGTSSFFERYDTGFTLQQTIPNPTGMGAQNNIFDFVYDPSTGHFFGLATIDEGGTTVQTNIVFEFEMGGAVVAQYTLPFMADGIGQFNQVIPVELQSFTIE